MPLRGLANRCLTAVSWYPQSSYGVTSKTYTFWRAPAGHEDSHIEPGTVSGTYGSPANPAVGMAALAAQHANALFQHNHGHGHHGHGHGHRHGHGHEHGHHSHRSPLTPLASHRELPPLSGGSNASEQTPRFQSLTLAELQEQGGPGTFSPDSDAPDAHLHLASPGTRSGISTPPVGAVGGPSQTSPSKVAQSLATVSAPAPAPSGVQSPPRYGNAAELHLATHTRGGVKKAVLDRDAMLEQDRYGGETEVGDSCEWTKAKPQVMRAQIARHQASRESLKEAAKRETAEK